MCSIPWDEVNAFQIMKLLIAAGANLSDQTFQVAKINHRVHVYMFIIIVCRTIYKLLAPGVAAIMFLFF